MSILGSIGKAISDPGSLVQDALGSVLPKEVSGVLGNAGAGLVDLFAGKEMQALQHGLAAVTDLPQLGKSAASALSSLGFGGTAGFEPSAPGGNAGQMVASGSWKQPTTLQDLLKKLNPPTVQDLIKQLLQALQGRTGNVTININTTPGQAASTTTPAPGAPSAAAPLTPSSSTGASSSAAPSGSGASTSSSSQPASTDQAKAQSAADLKNLMGMNNTDFMNAVRSGNIPDSVMNDPKAMMQIQDRMNQITQMNQLLTSMMQAMHQMEMSIIQNIRV